MAQAKFVLTPDLIKIEKEPENVLFSAPVPEPQQDLPVIGRPFFQPVQWLVRLSFLSLIPAVVLNQLTIGRMGLETLLIYLILVMGLFFGVKFFYAMVTFELYLGKVIYRYVFLWEIRQEILLRNIKEVTLKRGPLQRFFGLETIELSSAAYVGKDNTSGFKLFNIKQQEGLYDLISKQIQAARV